MLYGNFTGFSSSNPLGIYGGSINLKASLNSCPNGIKIHFSNILYQGNGTEQSDNFSVSDINIPKGSSSGASEVS